MGRDEGGETRGAEGGGIAGGGGVAGGEGGTGSEVGGEGEVTDRCKTRNPCEQICKDTGILYVCPRSVARLFD